MRDKIFISFICAVTLIVMIYAPFLKAIENAGIAQTEQMGNVIEPAKIYEDDNFAADILNKIEEAKAAAQDTYINYLPFYANVVTSVRNMKVNANQGINDMLSSAATQTAGTKTIEPSDTGMISTDDIEADAINNPAPEEERRIVSHSAKYLTNTGGTNVYAIDAEYSDGEQVSLITLALSTSPSSWEKRMRNEAKLVNSIAEVCEELGVNTYYYACSRLQDGEFFADYIPGEVSLNPLVDDFFLLLNPSVKSGRLKVDTIEESIQKLFLTDHHWNAYGMYESYRDIINLMREDTPAIPEPREIGTLHEIPDASFHGTNARMAGYYEVTDTFYFYDYDLPEHTLVASNTYDFSKRRDAYLSGNFEQSLSADHYVNFYPYSEYLKYPTNSTSRNVLILADSYSRGISELLSSNFDETFIFDYRRINQIKNLKSYIDKNNITDVLFMQYSLRGIFDNQADNTLGSIDLK